MAVLRISAKVIDASTGLSLWSGVFDRAIDDVFAVQTEIAHAIADSLRVTLAPAPRQLARPPGQAEIWKPTCFT